MMPPVASGEGSPSATPPKRTCGPSRDGCGATDALSHYTDKASIFRAAGPQPLPEQLRGDPLRTQFGRAVHELGIEWIAAHSPQAKDYASHCTSWARCDTTSLARRRCDSFTPWAFRGGLSPGCSYRQSFLSLQA